MLAVAWCFVCVQVMIFLFTTTLGDVPANVIANFRSRWFLLLVIEACCVATFMVGVAKLWRRVFKDYDAQVVAACISNGATALPPRR